MILNPRFSIGFVHYSIGIAIQNVIAELVSRLLVLAGSLFLLLFLYVARFLFCNVAMFETLKFMETSGTVRILDLRNVCFEGDC